MTAGHFAETAMINTATTSTNRYGVLASEIYDLDKPVGASPDTRFHLERFKGFDRPILEPACGSGRSLIPLMEAGLDVCGFDRSPEMLQRSRGRCAERGLDPKVDQQALEDFRYSRKFGAVFVPVGSFTLIDDLDVAQSVLRRFRDALEPGGVIVLDLPSLAYLADVRPDRRRWTAANGDLLTLDGVRTRTDWTFQRAESLFRYERWRENRLVETELEPMVQRYWGLNELRHSLSAAGFTDIAVIGGYDRRRPVQASDSVFTFEATRA